MGECSGKVTKPLDHKGTLPTTLSTCWLLWQCREPQRLLIGSWLILWEEPADDEEIQVLRAQLGLFTLTEEQGIEVERGMAWEKSEIQMKILRVCWSQRQWTWNFKKSKLFGINSEFLKRHYGCIQSMFPKIPLLKKFPGIRTDWHTEETLPFFFFKDIFKIFHLPEAELAWFQTYHNHKQ